MHHLSTRALIEIKLGEKSIDMKNDTTVIDQGDSEVLKIPKKLKPPRKYKVIYHNDDYTPMEFVTWSLMEFYKRTEIDAQSITLEVHKLGCAVAGVYEYQIAEQKIYEVLESARVNEFPLQVTGEAE